MAQEIQTEVVYVITDPLREITEGVLCVIAPPGLKANDEVYIGGNGTGIGAGIAVKKMGNFICTVNGIEYQFTIKGAPSNTAAKNYWLYLATATKVPLTIGSVAGSIGKKVITRKAGGQADTEVSLLDKMSVSVDNLNARDQFALKILQGFMEHIDNPAALGPNEISYYCDSAYTWASYLMANAANSRAMVEVEEGASASESPISPEDLISNTEKLLNNLVVEIAKTNVADEEDETVISKFVTVSQMPALIETLNKIADDKSINSIPTALNEQRESIDKLAFTESTVAAALNEIKESLNHINVTITYTE